MGALPPPKWGPGYIGVNDIVLNEFLSTSKCELMCYTYILMTKDTNFWYLPPKGEKGLIGAKGLVGGDVSFLQDLFCV